MDSVIEFTVIGIPKPWKRPVRFQHPSGKFVSWSPKSDWFGLIYSEAVKHRPPEPLDGPLRLDATFRFPRPRSVRKDEVYMCHRPDEDNLKKALMDAITYARLWVDDSRICDGRVMKIYSEPPGVTVRILRAGQDGIPVLGEVR
jgi:Holliday junction resolvase RusA-like endonuclease